jgi:hypothetical protein
VADEADVCNAIVAVLDPVLEPLIGTTVTPPVYADLARYGTFPIADITVSPGREILSELTERLEQEKSTITVYVDEKLVRVEQYQNQAIVFPVSAKMPGLTLSVDASGYVCTLGGVAQAGDVVGVLQGSRGGATGIVALQTLASIAAAVAASAVADGLTVTAVSNVLTVGGGTVPEFNVGTTATAFVPAWRRRKVFNADLYCADYFTRPVIAQAIASAMPPGTTLQLADGTQATLIECDAIRFDEQSAEGAFIERARWLFEFVTGSVVPAIDVVSGQLTETVTPGVLVTPPYQPMRPGML